MLDEKELTKLILGQLGNGLITKEAAIELIKYISNNEEDQVAIIGMGCMVPNIDDYNVLWKELLENKTLVSECPKNRLGLVKDILGRKDGENLNNYHKGAFFDNPDKFDYSLFGMTKEEADHMDPGQRIMLMTAYRTIEDAGYLGEKNEENDTVVYIANNFTNALFLNYLTLCGFENFDVILRNWSSGLATRISHYFNLKGMSLTCDNSCAAGTTAILNAARMIKNGECKTALVGGISMFITPDKAVTLDWVFNHEKDAITRPFDKNSEGMYFGEGCAALYIKSLKAAIKDGDRIHAIIKGGAVNNNGRDGNFFKSSVNDVKKVMTAAISNSKIDITNLGYLESEGYIEKMEEAIQFRGLSDGIKNYTDNKQFCAIGVLSPNLGYLQAASGIINAIKSIMALKERKIPPILRFSIPSDMINYINSTFYINDKVKEWEVEEGSKRLAATYAYGFGGNNLLVFYEEYNRKIQNKEAKQPELFLLSAVSEKSFVIMIDKYIEFLKDTKERFEDICYTASVRRSHYKIYRCAIVASTKEELSEKLSEIRENFRLGNKHTINDVEMIKNKSKRYNDTVLMEEAVMTRDLNSISKFYIKGINTKYEKLFHGRMVSVISLPVYEFDLSSCWIQK